MCTKAILLLIAGISIKTGLRFLTRFLIQGPHYYTLVAHGKNENTAAEKFFNSFEITPFVYKEMKERKDTSMYFSVTNILVS